MNTYTEEQISEWKSKAEKWDALDKQLEIFYFDEEGNYRSEDDVTSADGLIGIGEKAAMAFGYL